MSTNKLKVFSDLDRTLLSTDDFLDFFQESFLRLGIKKDVLLETYRASKKDKLYRPETHLKLLSKEGFALEELRKTFEKVMARTSDFLYEDTVPFLKERQKEASFIIVTWGDEWFQKEKVRKSGLKEFLEKVAVSKERNKVKALSPYLFKDEKAFFVDDDPFPLNALKPLFPSLVTVRMKRKGSKYTERSTPPAVDFEVKNLSELDSIIKNSS